MNRPLTEQERHWLCLGLATLERGCYHGSPLDPQPFLAQIGGLLVKSRCHCRNKSCQTVKFYRGQYRGRQRTLVFSETEDGRLLIVTCDADTGRLLDLEII